MIPLVADLTAAVGAQYGPYVHRGATSQDILDTATMLVATRTLDLVLTDLDRTARALARLAADHRDTAMPGRTLTQHAVPTTFGLKAAGWRSLVLDARDRASAVRHSLPAQLGGAAGTLAAFTVFGATGGTVDTRALVAAYARELGLAEPVLPWHTLRTPIADLAGALAFTAGALGKIAADVLTLARTEIAEVSGGRRRRFVRDAAQGESRTVDADRRRGPARAAARGHAVRGARRRGRAGRCLARRVGAAQGAAARDRGRRRDAAELTEGLRVHADVMRQHLGLTHGLIVSERLAAELAPVLGRARAKALLTEVAARTYTEGRSLAELLAEEPELKDLPLDELTDPARYTGSAGALTDRALERP